MIRTVVGFGSNLGDRLANMRTAAAKIAGVARIERTSRVYATEPVGGPPGQPEFLNAAALLTCSCSPRELLLYLLSIEKQLGRIRGERFGPRSIDLDVLWIDGVVVAEPDLEVPHPRLRERAFALVPLLEIVPDAADPRSGEPYRAPAGDLRPTSEIL